VFCIYLRTNSDLCHLQHKLIGFYNRDEKCLQCGTDWVFKYSGLLFVFKGLKQESAFVQAAAKKSVLIDWCTLKTAVIRSLQAAVTIHQATRRDIARYLIDQEHRWHNLNSCMLLHFHGTRHLEMKRENVRSYLTSNIEPYST
jgi:hypothetical protein